LRNLLLNIVLFLIAFFLSAVIFIADLYSPPTLAIGVLYSLVILYSWLLTGRYILFITGIVCSILILLAGIYSPIEGSADNLYGINQILSLICCWVCVTLIALAKRSFNELQTIIDSKEDEVFEKTAELVKLNLSLEGEVLHRTRELKAKNEELSQFAYVTSHDLKEPVNTIIGFVELMSSEKREMLDDEAVQYLKHINSSADRMGLLIEDLLEYSRIGRRDKLKVVDSHKLVEEVEKDLSASISSSEASIEHGSLPRLLAYPLEFRLLLQNLISNAIKFRKTNEAPLIRITAKDLQDHWHFSICDNGIGIDSKFQERIFTIFKRLHQNEEFQGTGIGLAHCKKIVELHQGKIWVESEPDVGSDFQFTISKSIN